MTYPYVLQRCIRDLEVLSGYLFGFETGAAERLEPPPQIEPEPDPEAQPQRSRSRSSSLSSTFGTDTESVSSSSTVSSTSTSSSTSTADCDPTVPNNEIVFPGHRTLIVTEIYPFEIFASALPLMANETWTWAQFKELAAFLGDEFNARLLAHDFLLLTLRHITLCDCPVEEKANHCCKCFRATCKDCTFLYPRDRINTDPHLQLSPDLSLEDRTGLRARAYFRSLSTVPAVRSKKSSSVEDQRADEIDDAETEGECEMGLLCERCLLETAEDWIRRNE